MAHYSLPGWLDHQHYRDRDPVWVKLYRDTLTSESWVMGTDISRLVQVASILLAARYKNAIPLNFPLLSRVASLDCTAEQFSAALDHLARFQFIEIHGEIEAGKHDASNTLATCPTTSEVPYLEKRREEKRREEGEAASAARPKSRATKIPSDWTPNAKHAEIAAEVGVVSLDREADQFRDFHDAKGSTFLNWDAAFRTWLRNANKFSPTKSNTPQKLPGVERRYDY